MYNIISEDTFIWEEFALAMYMYECHVNDKQIELNFHLEGMCANRNGLYRLLDSFCDKTGYDATRITVYTANMLEAHDKYRIVKVPKYWYEVNEIQKWVSTKQITVTTTPIRHFGSFVGRGTWDRLWLSTLLDNKFKSQTLQTYNSGLRTNYKTKESSGIHDHVGLDDLISYECDILPDVVDFLNTCPRIIEDDVEYIKTVKTYIPQDDHYPIQHPANLNIIKEYNNIFVDIICETRITGNVFFVTEKTWRCIVAKRPFIIMGPRYFLENLRKLGFKTFNDFWDESYDEYELHSRIQQMDRVLEVIGSWSLADLETKLVEMQEILDYNKQVFLKLDYNHIKEIFSE